MVISAMEGKKTGQCWEWVCSFKLGGQCRPHRGDSWVKLAGGTGVRRQIWERASVHWEHAVQGTARAPSYVEQNVGGGWGGEDVGFISHFRNLGFYSEVESHNRVLNSAVP